MPPRNITLLHYKKAGDIAGYIHAHAIERNLLSLDALSKRFGLCKTYLKRAFKYRYGTAVHAYIIRCRMDKAKDLMCEEGMTAKKVAYELGYHQICHFTQDFKKMMGLPPKQYRDLHCGRETGLHTKPSQDRVIS